MTALPRAVAASAAALLASVASVAGIYMPVDIRLVPVERLVQNLERRLAERPKDVWTLIGLARLHGMAYALKTEDAEAAVPRGAVKAEESPWYGYNARHLPDTVKAASDPGQIKRARAHLEQSLAFYRKALELDSTNLVTRLGHAWALEQSGQKTAAIAGYRDILGRSRDQSNPMGLPDLQSVGQEAITHLIKLLDGVADAAEIRALEKQRGDLMRLPRPITPIAVPLADNVTEIVDLQARVLFDADGSGWLRPWTWITPAAGWLVYDAVDRGHISSALQLFGSVTFWLFWTNGYEALASLDDDGNDALESAELRHLAIWHDRNGNGRSEAGEVRPLSHYGIVAINCLFEPGDGRTVAAYSPQGVRFARGAVRPSYDVILRRSVETLTR